MTEKAEEEKNDDQFNRAAGKTKGEIEGYEEGLKHGKKIFFPLLLILAMTSEFTDPIPIIGWVMKAITLLVIWYNFGIVGKAPGYLEEKHKIELSWKIRMVLRVLGFIDFVPGINLLPLTTISVLFVWFKNKKDIAKKEDELEQEHKKRKSLFRGYSA